MPTSGAKQYSVRRIMVPALGTVSISYDYQPDQVVMVPELPLTSRMDVYVDGTAGGCPLPLYAMGPLAFPGVSMPQTIKLTSFDASIRYVRVVAQKGYQPTQIVPPTTLVVPESAYPQAQTRFEQWLPNMGTPVPFLHNHVGSDVIVGIGVGEYTTGVDSNIVGVTVDGVAANLLGLGHIWVGAANRSMTFGWYHRTNVPEGNVQVNTALLAATADTFYGMALSFAAGIRTGNISTQGVAGAAPPPFSVVGQEIGSIVLCGLHAGENLVVVSEVSGAPPFDPIHTPGAAVYVGMWRRTGIGTHVFDFAVTGAAPVAAAALEILPRI